MNRRNFIRVLGGGAVAASAAGLAACSEQFPAEAVAPWLGPQAENDLRRWALGYAILAPNSHNRQPWLVDLSQRDAIVLYVDRQRMLPETDPWYRQIVVSQGTFIESLVIALKERGIAPTVALFPEGEFEPRQVDSRPVARISWTVGAAAPPRDPLFAQLLLRHTAKVAYDTTREVKPATLQMLRDAVADLAADAPVRFGSTIEPALRDELRKLCWESAKAELLTPRTVMERDRKSVV